MASLAKDVNSVAVAGGVSDLDGVTILPFKINHITGRLMVTSTGGGGGGFTSLDPTETPNGNLKVFTFASATAQPSYIISDGVWLKATSKAGTVNWTWAAGPLQATMTIPPNDDIEGIQ